MSAFERLSTKMISFTEKVSGIISERKRESVKKINSNK